jgi:phosphate/sulfate permease
MAGSLTYISIFMLMGVWVLAWAGVTALCGSFFNLPLSTSSLVGALLGPIGVVAVILLGTVNRTFGQTDRTSQLGDQLTKNILDDPFL